jgi:regulator of protease activity HflC (stomatin/prohibitin superfamily)
MILQPLIILLVIAVIIIQKGARIIYEYERGVVFRLGRIIPIKTPGLKIIIPFVDKIIKVDQRKITIDVPGQDVITKDNISIKVSAVLQYRVIDSIKALTQIEDYHYATNQIAQTTIRTVCGEVELDDLLTKREELNIRIQEIVDRNTESWGVKVVLVELKHIDLPQEMQRAMAKQAEAERERRAKIIKAEGELQASEKLTAAAEVMSKNPSTMQLRYLETLRDISVEHNSTILFPVPLELLRAFSGEKDSSKKQND